MARELQTDEDLRRVLSEVRTIAELGAHVNPAKPACYVPDYLHTQGYRIIPVNPQFAGRRERWGERFRSTLAEIGEPVDLIDVFRRSDAIPEHLDDILALTPRPQAVWLQQGIRNDDAAAALVVAGIDVVQDHCTLADHRRFGLGPRR